MPTPRRAFAVLTVGVLLYGAALLGLHDGAVRQLLDATLGNALTAGIVALMWWRVHRSDVDRAVIVPIALGITLGVLNEVALDVAALVADLPVQGPHVVVGAALSIPCFLLAARQYARARLADRHRAIWLDAVAGLLALTAAWQLLVAGRLQQAVGPVLPGPQALSLVVPAVDVIVLLALMAIIIWCGVRSDVRLWALTAALALSAAGDLGWVVALHTGEHAPGNPVDALWTASALVTAAAVWGPAPRAGRLTVGVTRLLVPPTAVVLLCGLLLVVASVVPAPRTSLLLTGVALLLVVTRLALAYSELVPLASARRLSLTDELTGLGNRRALLAALAEVVQREEPACLLLLDLQRFKEVNDALGHSAGDELLRSVAARIRASARPGDVLARLGGDEFAVLLPRTGLEQAVLLAHTLAAELAAQHVLAGAAVHVPADVGVAARPVHAASSDGLLRCADVAMYTAKRERSAVALFDESMDRRSGDRLRLVEELRQALSPGGDGGSLVLHFQPKIDLATGAVAGAEALVRWQHPRLGLLDPTSFLGTAEQRGLMQTLTRQVLDEALREAALWEAAGHGVPVAVNLSVSDVLDGALPGRVRRALERHGVDASALHLEITESVVMGDSGRARTVVAALASLGVRLSVDDYGTGYSSLAYLRDLAVHDLKLDRSFVREVSTDARAAAIVRSTVDLAHSIGLGLVAEGVADEAGLELLVEMGCDQSQSHLHSPPLPAGEFRRWLAAQRGLSAGRPAARTPPAGRPVLPTARGGHRSEHGLPEGPARPAPGAGPRA
ncbi:hypothetical protein NUM3379_01990 [Kineococcus sp. NUM-3379]